MRARAPLALAALFATLGSAVAAADQPWQLAWSIPASGLWQPAVSEDLVVTRSGDEVSAFGLADGKRLWRQRIEGLVPGRYVLAAHSQYVYALAQDALFVLQRANGAMVHKRPLDRATRVLLVGETPYVADVNGVKRLDPTGRQVLGETIITGTLERAEGDLVVLHRWIAKAKGPNRLSVVSLKSGSVTYEFKLLPTGAHRVAAFDEGRLIFIDHSRFDRQGKPKLYYTEADAQRSKKLRDVALSRHFAQSRNEDVDAGRSTNGYVYIAAYGPLAAPATLLAYDPAQNQLIWTRSGNYAVSEIAVFGGQLWTTVRGADARTEIVAYDADSGDTRVRVPLDEEPATGPLVSAGERVLLRTRDKLICLSRADSEVQQQGKPETRTPAAALTAAQSRPGWRVYRDPALGYTIEVPTSWELEKKLIKELGAGRHAIPYVLYEPYRGQRRYVASVHVLVRPAGGQDVEALWSSVLDYWRARERDLRTDRVRRFEVDGVRRIFGVYSFLDRRFNRQDARSLCIVHKGRAYELRARVAPTAPRGTWRQVAQTMRGFRVETVGH